MATQIYPLASLQATMEWFNKAREAVPQNIRPKIRQTQLACHIEEVAEMLEQMRSDDPLTESLIENAFNSMQELQVHLKTEDPGVVIIKDRKLFLDSIADQVVTVTGVAKDFNFALLGALGEVNRANFSKYVEDQPVYDANWKIMKGPNYVAPDLQPFV